MWSVDYVLTVLTGHFLFVSYTSMFTVLPLYVVELGGLHWHVGIVVGAFGVISLFARPFLGRWIAIIGPKRIAVYGLGLFAISALLYLPSLTFWWLVPVQMLRGIGLAATPVATSTIVANLAPMRQRAEALAYMGIGIGTAGIYSPVFAHWIGTRFGFDAAFVYASVAALLGCLFALGLSSSRTNPVIEGATSQKTAFFPRTALIPTLIFLSYTATSGPVSSFLPLLVDERGLGNPGLYYTVHSVIVMLSLAGSGRIADRFGRPAVIVPGLVSVAVGMFILMAASNQAMLLASAFLSGAGFGLVQPGMQALTVDRVSPRERGPAMATLQSAWDIGSSGTSIGLGPVATAIGSASTFGIVGVGALAGALGFTIFNARSPAVLPESEQPAARVGDDAAAEGSDRPLPQHERGRESNEREA